MATEHATLMVLKVNLECYSCFLKVKKVLGNLPQIGDQVFIWKENEVRISVICCDPEKIRRKLYSKAGKTIKNVDIRMPAKSNPKDTDKPKTAEKPKDLKKPNANQKPKELEKKVVFVEPEKPKSNTDKPKELEKKVVFVEPEKPKSNTDKPKTDEKSTKPIIKSTKADPSKTPQPAPVNPTPQPPGPVNGYPLQVYPLDVPIAAYCGQCYDGGPCHHDSKPVPPPSGSFGYGYEYGFDGGRAVSANRLDYFSEENPSGCSIM